MACAETRPTIFQLLDRSIPHEKAEKPANLEGRSPGNDVRQVLDVSGVGLGRWQVRGTKCLGPKKRICMWLGEENTALDPGQNSPDREIVASTRRLLEAKTATKRACAFHLSKQRAKRVSQHCLSVRFSLRVGRRATTCAWLANGKMQPRFRASHTVVPSTCFCEALAK